MGYFKEVGQIARTFWLSMPLVEKLLLLCVTSKALRLLGKEHTIHELPCTWTLIGCGTAASVKVFLFFKWSVLEEFELFKGVC